MAYGLIYNLNFSSNIAGNRKHRISIFKEGHTATITTADNNIIGTEEPAVLIWDNTDDIYNSIMGSRLEINLYSDPVKQVDVLDILNSTDPAKFKVEFYMENNAGTLQLYWFGYLSNANYEESISSVPVPYKLIATDLLATLKNVFVTESNTIIESESTYIKYIANLLALLPQSVGINISNDIQLKPSNVLISNSFEDIHKLQWLFPYKNGFELFGETAEDYLDNALKLINARIFFASSQWYIFNNATYKDTPSYDVYSSSGAPITTSSENQVKTIPTSFKAIGNDLSVRYESPIDSIEVIGDRNQYASTFDGIGFSLGEINNLSPYPNFETKPAGILLNSTFYSDDFTSITQEPEVKSGNYSIKTKNYITTGTPSQKIMDTGFVGEFQWNNTEESTFFVSYYINDSPEKDENLNIYYSLVREVSITQDGNLPTRSSWTGSQWQTYTDESTINVNVISILEASTDKWNEESVLIPAPTVIEGNYARYRVILWQPKINNIIANARTLYFDEVFISRRKTLKPDTKIRTISRISTSDRNNNKLKYNYQHVYPVKFNTTFQSDDITFASTIGYTQLNEIIAQQILNDNREHIRRYSISVFTEDFTQFLSPRNKININFTGFQSARACIIDRLKYMAKSGIYQIECHENNQTSNVTLNTELLK